MGHRRMILGQLRVLGVWECAGADCYDVGVEAALRLHAHHTHHFFLIEVAFSFGVVVGSLFPCENLARIHWKTVVVVVAAVLAG